MDYKVVTAVGLIDAGSGPEKEISEQVTTHLRLGWKLYGNLTASEVNGNIVLSQALVSN